MDPVTLGIALAGGAAGKAVGNSPITGEHPWGKILGPISAVLLPIIWQHYGPNGEAMTTEQAAETGLAIGAAAVGLFSAGKNVWQLIRSLTAKRMSK